MSVPLLDIKGINVRYSGLPVLHGVSLTVNAGETVCVVGANGAGKSTILRAVMGSQRAFEGQIFLAGREIQRLRTEDIVRLGIVYVPEEKMLFRPLSVEENLRLGAYVRHNRAEMEQDMEHMFTRFPILKQRRHQQAGTLSGGEQQMLAISRALMLRPKLLLLDEPSFGLAPLIVAEIFRIMRTINKEDGVSMLLVEQNASLALDLADHAYLLETGRVALSGPSDTIKNDESVRRAYLGY